MAEWGYDVLWWATGLVRKGNIFSVEEYCLKKKKTAVGLQDI